MTKTVTGMRGDGVDGKRSWALLGVIIALTALVYIPNFPSTYLNIDYPAYERVIRATDYSQTAIDLFLDTQGRIVTGYYAPLGSVGLMLDKLTAGSHTPVPRATFMVNLILHCLCGLLLFLLLRALQTPSLATYTAVFIFLIHPLHIPSVLWFAERKTLLAAVFYLGSFYSYVRYRKSGGYGAYTASLCGFALGLLSKPTVAVLPLMLLVTGYPGIVPVRETHTQSASFDERSGAHPDFYSWGKALWPVAPFFLMAAAMALLTIKTESPGGASIPILERPFVTAASVWFYAYKVFVPTDIIPFTAKWTVDLQNPVWWLPLTMLLIAGAAVFRFRDRIGRRFIWGIANFLIPLLPVIGLVSFGWLKLSYVGYHLVHLSMIGAAYCIGMVLVGATRLRTPALRYSLLGALLCWSVALPVTTYAQARVWKNPLALWKRTVALNSQSRSARAMLAYAYEERGDLRLAEKNMKEAIALPSEMGPTRLYSTLGGILLRQGKTDEAVQSLRQAISLDPTAGAAYGFLGEAMLRKGDIGQAEKLFHKAIDLQPDSAAAYNNLGNLMLGSGRTDKAIELFEKAVGLQKDAAEAHNNLGAALMRRKETDKAREQFILAVTIKPNYAEAHANLGTASLNLGRVEESISHFREAVRLNDHLFRVGLSLGIALERAGKTEEAVKYYEEVIRRDPASKRARLLSASALVRLGKARSAIPHLEKVLETAQTDYKLQIYVGDLLMSLSEWRRAAEHYERALEIRPDDKEAMTKLEEARSKVGGASTPNALRPERQ